MDGGCGVLGYWGIGGRHGRTLAESSGIGVGCRVLGYWDIRVGRGHTRTFIESSFYMRQAGYCSTGACVLDGDDGPQFGRPAPTSWS